jgi:flagellar hook-associated protein 1
MGASSSRLFTDGGLPYSGAITAGGSQMIGFAGRIAVNPSVLGRSEHASSCTIQPRSPATPRGPTSFCEQLSQTSMMFPPQSGIGSAATPFQGSLPGFLQQVIFQQGEAAAGASQLSQGQSVVVNALQERFSEVSGVNVDQEMAYLLQLQSAYSANARVLYRGARNARHAAADVMR